MNAIEIVGAVLLIISSILIITIVMLQEGKQAGIGAISGESSGNFLEKNGGRTKDALLSRFTKILATVFFVVTLALNLIIHFAN